MRVEPVNDNALPKEGILGGAAGLATKEMGYFQSDQQSLSRKRTKEFR